MFVVKLLRILTNGVFMKSDFYKRTKIVATIGPAVATKEAIESLLKAGANVFRLNTSHGDMDDHREKFKMIREVSKKLDIYCGIMVDLQGPKIRVGNLIEEINLKNGDEVIFQHSQNQKTPEIIPVDYKGISKDVSTGSKILLDDGKIAAKVIKVQDDKVWAKITNGGILKSRKGLNIPGSTASLDALTPKDIEYVKFAVEMEADFIALSFVRKAEDVLLCKKYINDLDSKIPVIAKLEKPEAIKNLNEIISVSDCIMVARGDLGIELSPVEVPVYQKLIISECNKQKKPVIVATQMLESMINEPIPTRAEVSDVANAIIDGADAVMLSGETSVGKFATEAVETMSKIAQETEKSAFYKFDKDFEVSEDMALTRQAIVFGADKMLKYVNAKAVLSFSHFGYSTRLMSKLKPSVPIILVSDLEQTCRKMSIAWGVCAFYKKWDSVLGEDMLLKIDDFLINEARLNKGDYVVITGSAPNLITGRTNFVRVHKIGT